MQITEFYRCPLIRSIVLAESFLQEDNEELTEEEKLEVARNIEIERLRRTDPVAYAIELHKLQYAEQLAALAARSPIIAAADHTRPYMQPPTMQPGFDQAKPATSIFPTQASSNMAPMSSLASANNEFQTHLNNVPGAGAQLLNELTSDILLRRHSRSNSIESTTSILSKQVSESAKQDLPPVPEAVKKAVGEQLEQLLLQPINDSWLTDAHNSSKLSNMRNTDEPKALARRVLRRTERRILKKVREGADHQELLNDFESDLKKSDGGLVGLLLDEGFIRHSIKDRLLEKQTPPSSTSSTRGITPSAVIPISTPMSSEQAERPRVTRHLSTLNLSAKSVDSTKNDIMDASKSLSVGNDGIPANEMLPPDATNNAAVTSGTISSGAEIDDTTSNSNQTAPLQEKVSSTPGNIGLEIAPGLEANSAVSAVRSRSVHSVVSSTSMSSTSSNFPSLQQLLRRETNKHRRNLDRGGA